MSIFKCKMCGGTIEFSEGASVGVCDYCGTKQTLPRLDNDKKANLYDRANHFRRNNDFDKAMSIYQQILNEDSTDAEAYWSLVLCRYGIEYVEDPQSHRRVPTVNRAQFTSVFADEDYKSALQYADANQREIYENEAKEIDDIQKGILAISQKEKPFDVFICYKETDANGRRTQDSVLANDLYHQLTQEGFKVFFSRITLEDKLGTAYEPYIFAALNSAKVMVVLGTRPEYFNAVWVRNEWSRYLALVRNSGGKKILIPAYKDMDPYDLPEEFSHLQAQDMSKLGFMQDLIRGVKKIIGASEQKSTIRETLVVNAGSGNTAPLLKRVFMFLEDGNWQEADEYCEKVLDIDPECAEAYLGKLMAERNISRRESLASCNEPFDTDNNYQKAIRFGDEKLKAELGDYINQIKVRNENARMANIYNKAQATLRNARCEQDYRNAAGIFKSIPDFMDAAKLAEHCKAKAEEARKDAIYNDARCKMTSKREATLNEAIKLFQTISGWRDADEQICACQRKIEEAAREEAELLAWAKKQAKKRKKKSIIVLSAAVVLIAIITAISLVVKHNDEKLRGGVIYTLSDTGTYYCVSGCDQSILEEITILQEYKGLPVTQINGYAFYSCNRIKKVIIPGSIELIGESAFRGCMSLTNVTINDGVKSIGKYAFGDCKGLTSVTIRSSVTDIGESAFRGCVELTSITIPDGVTNIMAFTFSDCAKLKIVYLPSSVEFIGTRAFNFCQSLEKISFQGSGSRWNIVSKELEWDFWAGKKTSSGKYKLDFALATTESEGLKYILISDKKSYIVSGIGKSKDTEILIPSMHDGLPVTGIASEAFLDCRSIENIKIPNSVVSIGESAFKGCTNLDRIIIPDSVVSIGKATFSGCTSLNSITIPDSVISIGKEAFIGCMGLKSIKIPNGVTSIGVNAFSGCLSLNDITMSSNLTTIGNYAFNNCKSLTNVIIPNSVARIGDAAFKGCTGLTSITMPKGMTGIGHSAFSDCQKLKNVTIPDSVTSVGNSAFENCTELESISLSGNMTKIGNSLFKGCTALKSINIPRGVKSIGESAFNGCKGLAGVTFSEGIESIGDMAFYNCTKLTMITIPSSVNTIGICAFSTCTNLRSVRFMDATGWRHNNGQQFSAILSNAQTAAKCLTETYRYYQWTKN